MGEERSPTWLRATSSWTGFALPCGPSRKTIEYNATCKEACKRSNYLEQSPACLADIWNLWVHHLELQISLYLITLYSYSISTYQTSLRNQVFELKAKQSITKNIFGHLQSYYIIWRKIYVFCNSDALDKFDGWWLTFVRRRFKKFSVLMY